MQFLESPTDSRPGTLAVGITCEIAIFVLQLVNSSAAVVTWPVPRRLVMLVAQGLVTFLPLLLLGNIWGGMAGFFAGSALLLLPGWPGWTLFSAVVVGMLAGSLSLDYTAGDVAYVTAATLDTGLVVFGLSRLSQVVNRLNATRAQLAQLAVVRERERFARDLHDLLGYSLSAITLKAELTKRLVSTHPGSARDELADLLDISRQALADVRLVATGYRNMSLSKEVSSAAALLSVAGIASQVHVDCSGLDEKVDTVLATVLREAVTNLLRHSNAKRCAVEAIQSDGRILLRISNDGVAPAASSHRAGGGLENLAVRMRNIGGTLNASVRCDGQFEVLATVESLVASGEMNADAEDPPG